MAFCSGCGGALGDGVAFCSVCGQKTGTAATAVSGGAAAAPAQERVFFEGPGARVTNSRFVVGAQTYAMAGVTSVSAAVENPPIKGPVILGLLGAILLLAGLGMGKDGVAGAVIGVVMVVLAILWFRSLKATHYVVLRSSSGETKALSSTDGTHIAGVVEALNSAIVHRG